MEDRSTRPQPISVTHPDLANELADQSLRTVLTATSGRNVEWRCDGGHRWLALVGTRIHGSRRGCPKCKPKSQWATTPLNASHPDLADELVDQDLRYITFADTSIRAEWRCAEGHVWTARIEDRARGLRPCPRCLTAGRHLTDSHPDLADQLVDQNLRDLLTAGSGKKVEWRCTAAHTWTAVVSNRARNGTGCPGCLNRRRPLLTESHPELAAQLVDQSLRSTLTAGASKKVEWRCINGHVWSAVVQNRAGAKTGCPDCRRSLSTLLTDTHPDLADQLVDHSLRTKLTSGSDRKVEWFCSEGHKWTAIVSNRARNGTGCPKCTVRGFGSDPALCYLAVHLDHRLFKIGAVGSTSKRVSELEKLGWQIIAIARFDAGVQALEMEKSLLGLFRLHPQRRELQQRRTDAGEKPKSTTSFDLAAFAAFAPFDPTQDREIVALAFTSYAGRFGSSTQIEQAA